MGDYRDVTSNLEGRLLLLKGKVKDGTQPKPSDLFLSRGPQSFHVSLRTAGVKPFEDLQDSSYNSATSFNTSEELLTDHHSAPGSTVRQCGTFETTQTKCLEASIVLAEPALYVQSYDKVHAEAHTSAVLRGIVQLRVPETGIARPISLELCGFSSTQWPESWRLRNVGKTDQHKFFSKKMRLCNPISKQNVNAAQYAIDFELPVSSVLPETIDLPMGRVNYELVVTCGDVQLCRRTIRVVRMNCMCSLESAEPWVVTGQQDFIRFFFLFHGSSFRIGGPVPITVRLSHYSQVTWHQLEIRLVEDIEYSTHNGRALRILSRDRGALLRRQVGGAIRTASQVEVESIAPAAKNVPMANLNVYPPTIKSLTANSLDVGTMNLTETVVMDEKVDLRLPPCGDNKNFPKSRRIHHGTAYRPMHVQHYLKVIILVSRPLKATNQEMTYELVLRIPIHIISCKVRETDTLLPAYRSGPDVPDNIEKFVCICDAHQAGVPSSTETAIFSQYLAEGGRDLCDTSPPRYTG